MSETIQPLDRKTQASLRVKEFIDSAYNEGEHVGEILAKGKPTEMPTVTVRKEEAEIITEKGELFAIVETFSERQTVGCPDCDFGASSKTFRIAHYSVKPGTEVSYDPSKGFISAGGELKIRTVKEIQIEALHQLRELHSPTNEAIDAVNSLFD